MATNILSIYPKIYSTKIAVSNDFDIIYESEIFHSEDELFLYENLMEQMPFRRDAIMSQLRQDAVDFKSIQYVVAEGGLLKPCKSGVYNISKSMVGDLIDGAVGGIVASTYIDESGFFVHFEHVDGCCTE